jgi:hypothetical protein
MWCGYLRANHRYWGQSFLHTGDKRDAKGQLDKARSLSLSVSDRTQLDVLLRHAPRG